MIAAAFVELAALTSKREAARLVGMPRASYYRGQRPPVLGPPRPRPSPANKLSDGERDRVLELLRSEEHCESAPAQVWAALLDSGVYLCSIATMYRVLRSVGECRERRRQRTHPAKKKPELLATGPNQCWSWDITKLRGPARGQYFELYVIIDIYSRFVTGWMVAGTETGELAKGFIDQAVRRHGIKKGQLRLHADRGTSMTSKSVAQLLVDLGVDRSHSRPHVSNDNPYSEAAFKTLKYCPAFPEAFGSIQDARVFCETFFEHYNHRHYHSGIALLTPASVHYGDAERIQAERAATLTEAFTANPERFNRKPIPLLLPKEAWINDPTSEAKIKAA
ncbi:MAG: IS3 family transposase [Tepidiformaceae bacterium]